MTRKISTLAAAFCVALVPTTQGIAGDMMPDHVASRLGLTEAWKRYVAVPAGAQSIADQQIMVHASNPREYVEITIPMPAEAGGSDSGAPDGQPKSRVLVRIPTDRVGVDGKELGKQEAERLATNQIRRLKRRGLDASMSTQTVPRIHLYTLANDGTLECRDAETGESVWLTRVGNRELLYGEIGVSENHLSVINGPNLIQVDISNGEVIEEVATMGIPLQGSLHAGKYSLVPTIRGGIEGYPMDDPTLDPFMELVNGLALQLPTKSPDSTRVAWGTDTGFVYVMEASGEPSVLFRLNTDGIVSGRIASAPGDRFFFGSEEGQVYAIEATRTGRVLWSQPFGEPFYNGPMVVGDRLLLRSTYGTLYCLDTGDGHSVWNRPAGNVDELIGTIGNQVYIRNLSGALSVIDLDTGERIGTFGEVQPVSILTNTATDRIYMLSESGAVQCLKPIGADLPTPTETPPPPPAVEEKPDSPAEKPAGSPFDPNAGGDPFAPAAGADPFGAGGADPFGGGADPFGGGDAGNDPFGGADPFGGN